MIGAGCLTVLHGGGSHDEWIGRRGRDNRLSRYIGGSKAKLVAGEEFLKKEDVSVCCVVVLVLT